MIIIPELETVVITPPRNGSTSLRAACREAYPRAFTPYRHMERDGIPDPYKAWRVVAPFRDPTARLISLHKYMGTVNSTQHHRASLLWIKRMQWQGRMTFSEWVTMSQELFSDPYNDDAVINPPYATIRPVPITRKPQTDYYRSDVGPIDVMSLRRLAIELDVKLLRLNGTSRKSAHVTAEAQRFINTWHYPDLTLGTTLHLI